MQIQTKYSIPEKYKMNKINNWKAKFFFSIFCLRIIQNCGCSSFLFATLKGVSFYRFQDFQRIKFFHLHFRDGCDFQIFSSLSFSVSKVYFTSLFKVFGCSSHLDLVWWRERQITERPSLYGLTPPTPFIGNISFVWSFRKKSISKR